MRLCATGVLRLMRTPFRRPHETTELLQLKSANKILASDRLGAKMPVRKIHSYANAMRKLFVRGDLDEVGGCRQSAF